MKNAIGLSLALMACGPNNTVGVDDPEGNDGGMTDSDSMGDAIDCRPDGAVVPRLGFGSYEKFGLLGNDVPPITDELIDGLLHQRDQWRIYQCTSIVRDDLSQYVSFTIQKPGETETPSYELEFLDRGVFEDEDYSRASISITQGLRCEEDSGWGCFPAVEDVEASEGGFPFVQWEFPGDGNTKLVESLVANWGGPSVNVDIPPLGEVAAIEYTLEDVGGDCSVKAETARIPDQGGVERRDFTHQVDECGEEIAGVPSCEELKGVEARMLELRLALKQVVTEIGCNNL